MKKMANFGICLTALAVSFFVSGCATTIRQPAGSPQPAKTRLSEFKAFEIKHIEIAPEYASAAANQKAAKKIETILMTNMKSVLPGLQVVDKSAATAKPAARTLLIEPRIEAIKFICGAARFWVGAMAGSSAVLMKVTYKDKATDEILAAPEFYRAANAMAGGYSMGGTDNLMLEQIAQDVANYTSLNR